MLSKIWSTLIAVAAIVCMMVFLMALTFINPYRDRIEKLVRDHAHTLQFGAYIDVYDLSVLPHSVERLFIIRPENVVLYNSNGTLFYYLESSSVLCPREFSLVRFNASEIEAINESGTFSTVCTNVNSLTVLEHFVTLKNNVPDERVVLSVDQIAYSVLDIINLLIAIGLADVR
uniref:Per os infectivity factor 4 n=1 Tax=Lymantria dispar multicapsid nuclear polyhedrosis virus TaxID=10449 RepID=A0A1B1MR58_NPVLD|nr:per os infectivity factor 4 [Lymantria dispar multiple nucleopolyhedrovirus]